MQGDKMCVPHYCMLQSCMPHVAQCLAGMQTHASAAHLGRQAVDPHDAHGEAEQGEEGGAERKSVVVTCRKIYLADAHTHSIIAQG